MLISDAADGGACDPSAFSCNTKSGKCKQYYAQWNRHLNQTHVLNPAKLLPPSLTVHRQCNEVEKQYPLFPDVICEVLFDFEV